ncbi:MAG: vanadium-dependent haloperoxidase [Parvularculaceae bacterium]|nr:vanadium-dependent haloperoxidase [Parvularculaceae bacterium]
MRKQLGAALSALAIVAATSNSVQAEPAVQKWEMAYWAAEPVAEPEVNRLRLMTGLFLSMYLAGAEVDERYELNTDLPAADATADEAAAAAGAAYLAKYFDTKVGRLGRVKGLARRSDLQALADAAAVMAFEMATATKSDPVKYRPFAVPGRYVPTQIPGDVRTAHLQHYGYDSSLATKIAPPPPVDSMRFGASYNETRRLGGQDSTTRTEAQSKASMIFDLQDPHPMIYRIMERRDLSLFEQARVMAIYDMGADDMTAAQFAGKLHFQSWRPITAIRNGDLLPREDTIIDPNWTPLLTTPNSSEYPCGHCTFVSGTAALLELLLPLEEGEEVVILADDIYDKDEDRGFDGDLSDYVAGFEIRVDSYAEFAEQGALSRIHNGAHFRYSTDAGLALGKDVAAAVLEKWDGLED